MNPVEIGWFSAACCLFSPKWTVAFSEASSVLEGNFWPRGNKKELFWFYGQVCQIYSYAEIPRFSLVSDTEEYRRKTSNANKQSEDR